MCLGRQRVDGKIYGGMVVGIGDVIKDNIRL